MLEICSGSKEELESGPKALTSNFIWTSIRLAPFAIPNNEGHIVPL